MATPFPPQDNQKQQNEKPLKVYSEQYLEGQPLPVGVTTEYGDPPLFADGLPRVALPTGWVVVRVSDFVISSRYSGQPMEVISAEEFAERFGPSNLAEGGA